MNDIHVYLLECGKVSGCKRCEVNFGVYHHF